MIKNIRRFYNRLEHQLYSCLNKFVYVFILLIKINVHHSAMKKLWHSVSWAHHVSQLQMILKRTHTVNHSWCSFHIIANYCCASMRSATCHANQYLCRRQLHIVSYCVIIGAVQLEGSVIRCGNNGLLTAYLFATFY